MKIGEGSPAFIIAEMACAHNGSLDEALQLVDVAASSGADAVQLQIFSVKDYIVPQHPAYDVVRKLEMSAADWEQISQRAHDRGIILWTAAYDRLSADLAVKIGVDGFKVHSSDLSNPYLTEYLASFGKPITLSTGASTLEEIEAGIKFLQKAGCENVILMHGYQNFPTRIEEANLKMMPFLEQRFGLPVGYQDHTDGDDPLGMVLPMVALGFGARVIEKHFNLNRASKGIDHQSALDPQELNLFVSQLRQVEKAIGRGVPKPFTSDELNYRISGKKSIAAVRDIRAGEAISFEDIFFVRSTPGLPPTETPRIVGKKAKRAIACHENILLEDVA